MTRRSARRRGFAVRSALAAVREEADRQRNERDEAQRELRTLRSEEAELRAYARAAVAAHLRGEPDAVLILAGLLEERGILPDAAARPSDLLSEGYREVTSA